MIEQNYLFSGVIKLPDGTAQNPSSFEKALLHSSVSNLKIVHDDKSEKDNFRIIGNEAFEEPGQTPVVRKTPVYDFKGKTILVVDDVSFNLSLMNLFFRNTGATVLFAINGIEAIDTCISNLKVDIVLMDIQMPVMNGFEATREIIKHRPDMPVIAITAFVHSDDRQRCFDAGCIEFLSKPCSREELLKTVNKFL
jgi:two-component system, cell cycle response regulator DivK